MKIPPLAVLVVCMFIATVLKFYIPIYPIEFSYFLSLASLLIGLLFLVIPVASFVKNRTTVDPRNPERASKLITSGVYQISRNPMYVGMWFLLTSLVIWLGEVSSLASLIVFFLIIDRYQIENEEQALANRFGQEFRDYTQQVPRWLLF